MSSPTSSSSVPTVRSSDRREARRLRSLPDPPGDPPLVEGGRDQGAPGGAGGFQGGEIGGVAYAAGAIDFAPSPYRSNRGQPLEIRVVADACKGHDNNAGAAIRRGNHALDECAVISGGRRGLRRERGPSLGWERAD